MPKKAVGYIRDNTPGQTKAVEQGKQVGHLIEELIEDYLSPTER